MLQAKSHQASQLDCLDVSRAILVEFKMVVLSGAQLSFIECYGFVSEGCGRDTDRSDPMLNLSSRKRGSSTDEALLSGTNLC